MAKRGENIYLRKDGRYEGRYKKGRRKDGSIFWGYVYGKQYLKVKQRLTVLKAEYQSESSCAAGYGNGQFSDWLEYWLEYLVKPYIKISTYYGYRRIVDKYLRPRLGEKRMDRIETEEIQMFVDGLYASLSPSTIRGICRLLRSSLREAENREVIPRSPYRRIREPKSGSQTARVLSRREQKKIERECRKSGKPEYLLCLYTGLRLGELCGLIWEDINFQENLIYVRRTVQRIPQDQGARKTRILTDMPKTDSSRREIPVPDFLMKILTEMKGKEDRKDWEMIFMSNHKKGMDPRTVQVRFAKLCESLGIKGAHIHTLRHTYATRCLEKGIGYETVCALLGHSSPEITLKYYAHCTLENKRRCIKKLKQLAG